MTSVPSLCTTPQPSSSSVQTVASRLVDDVSCWLKSRFSKVKWCKSAQPPTLFYPRTAMEIFLHEEKAMYGIIASWIEARNVSRTKRPPNKFMIFKAVNHLSNTAKQMMGLGTNSLPLLAGTAWATLDERQKEPWAAAAKILKDVHELLFPSYRFVPQHIKRRTVGISSIDKGRKSRKNIAHGVQAEQDQLPAPTAKCPEVASTVDADERARHRPSHHTIEPYVWLPQRYQLPPRLCASCEAQFPVPDWKDPVQAPYFMLETSSWPDAWKTPVGNGDTQGELIHHYS